MLQPAPCNQQTWIGHKMCCLSEIPTQHPISSRAHTLHSLHSVLQESPHPAGLYLLIRALLVGNVEDQRLDTGAWAHFR